MHCIVLFLICSGLLRAADTLVPKHKGELVHVLKELETNDQRMDQRRRADSYRAIATKKIKKALIKNKAVQQKIQNYYEVERKVMHLGKLRIANNEHRAVALKLQNNLLLTCLWIVLLIVGIAIVVLYRWRIEHKKRSLQMQRAAFTAREQEKLRFSRELHDDFQSTLSIIHMIAVHEYDKAPENQRLEALMNTSKNAIQEIRKMSNVLYPREINTEGWIESLNSLIRRINEKSSELTFYLSAEHMECNREVQLILYRSIEELVQNTLSLSSAKEVFVSLRKNKKGIELHYLEKGHVKKQEKRDVKSIQERMHVLGGEFVRKRGFADKCEFKVFFSG